MVGERTVGMHRRLIAFCAARAWRRAAWPREEVAVAVASRLCSKVQSLAELHLLRQSCHYALRTAEQSAIPPCPHSRRHGSTTGHVLDESRVLCTLDHPLVPPHPVRAPRRRTLRHAYVLPLFSMDYGPGGDLQCRRAQS